MLCLRIDLDYVPWENSADSSEPAMLLKLLDFARHTGTKFHFFISTRSLRAFPTSADAILGEGHDLDWLTEHPTLQEFQKAQALFGLAGHKIVGLATHCEILDHEIEEDAGLKFVVGPESLSTQRLIKFVSHQIDGAHDIQPESITTLKIRPSAFAHTDPNLKALERFVTEASSKGIAIRTLRDAIKP